jgi:hypothetical protein
MKRNIDMAAGWTASVVPFITSLNISPDILSPNRYWRNVKLSR